jgi:hypothetical protein
MIRNLDGTPYRLSGDLRQFDSSAPEHELFNIWDQEAIRIGGSPIYYYEVFISQENIDPLYNEDRNKVWSQYPVELYANYEPVPSMNMLGSMGIDSPNEMVFELNMKAVLEAIGHPPKIGSRIFTPHLREHWELIQVNTGEYKMWTVLRYEFICKKFQESSTTGEGRVTQNAPVYKII